MIFKPAEPLPSAVEELMIGLDVVLAAQKGIAPDSPYPWLTLEPDAASIMAGTARKMGSADWYARYWHLDWPDAVE